MKILKTDSIRFIVSYKIDNKIDYKHFNSFEDALTFARRQEFNLSFVDLDVRDKTIDISSGFRSSICKVKNGQVSMIHGHYLTQLAKAGRYDAL